MHRHLLTFAAALAVVPCALAATPLPWEGRPFAGNPKAIAAAAAKLEPVVEPPWESPPSELAEEDPGEKPPEPPPAPADAEVLSSEVSYTFAADGSFTRHSHLVVFVRTRAGVGEWSGVSAAWEPWHEDRPTIRARTIAADGTVHELQAKSLTDAAEADDEDSEAPTYSDRHRVRGPLPAVEPGTVIEQEVTLVSRPRLAGAGDLERIVFTWDAPVRHTRIHVDAPASLPLTHALQGVDAKVVTGRKGSRVTLDLELGLLREPRAIEQYQPLASRTWPMLLVGAARSWSELAVAYAKVVDAQIAAGPVQELARTWGGADETRAVLVERLSTALGNHVRYTGLELADAALIPRPPAQTVERGFGDCKDMATLLVALLRARGLDADVVLLHTGWTDLDARVPGLGAFNHAIVRVAGSPEIWLDPTRWGSRPGDPLTGEEDRLALVADRATTALVHTPESLPSANRQVTTRELRLAEEGYARLLERREAWGSLAEGYRNGVRDVSEDKLRQRYLEWGRDAHVAKELSRLVVSGPEASTFKLELDFEEAQRGWTGDAEASAWLLPSSVVERLPDLLRWLPVGSPREGDDKPARAKRTNPLELPWGYAYELRYRVVPPPGYVLRELPPPLDSTGPVVARRRSVLAPDGAAEVTFEFDLRQRRFTPDELEAVRRALRPFEKSVQVLFDSAIEKAIDRGDWRAAVAEARRLVALHPTEAVHVARAARLYLRAGAGAVARREAKRAVELDPKSAYAQRTLGWVLQFDTLVRARTGDFDRDGSIEAYRRALAIEPDDTGVRADLANVLELAPDGTPFGPGARLAEAVTEWQDLRARKDEQADLRLAVALFRSGRSCDVLPLVDSLAKGDAVNELVVASEAVCKGFDAAEARARRLQPDASRRRQLFEQVAADAQVLHDYALAARFQRRAAEDGTAAERDRLLASAEVNARTKVLDAASFADDAIGAVGRFFLLARQARTTPAELARVFAPASLKEAPAALAGFRRGISRSSPRGDREALTDLSWAAYEKKVEGDATLGWRVRLQLSARVEVFAFVVQGEARPQILTLGAYPHRMAREAARFVAAGDGVRAGRWLDWLSDADSSPTSVMRYLWKRGSTDLAAACTAVAVLRLDEEPFPSESLADLKKAAASASGTLGLMLGPAMAHAYERLGRYDEALAELDRLEQLPFGEQVSEKLRPTLLRAAGRRDEVARIMQARLDANPDDVESAGVLMNLALDRGDPAQVEALGRRFVTAGTANAGILNTLAWSGLFLPKLPATALKDARTALERSHGRSAMLHTLALIAAESGHLEEAHEQIVKRIDDDEEAGPAREDWVVFGRMYEEIGLYEEATAAYRKVLVDGREPAPGTSAQYARRALERIRGRGP